MTSKKALFSLLLVVFIDLVGIGIVIPVLPALFFSDVFFGPATTTTLRGVLLGIAVAAYPIAQFFGAPIIGALSDKYGRKKLLMVSIFGTAVGYAMLAISIVFGQYWLLLFSRIIDGFTGGNISIVRSAIVDISTPSEKTKNFGLIGVAFGIGFILGPFLGGLFSNAELVSWFDYATPFWFACILSIVNLFLIWTVVSETLKEPRIRPLSWKTGIQDIRKGFSRDDLRGIYLASFLVMFGWSFFTQFFQVFLMDRFSFTVAQVGNFFAFIGACIIVTQGLLVRSFIHKFRSIDVLNVAIPLLAGTLLLLLLPTNPWYLYVINALIAVCVGFIMPSFSTILSNAVSAQEQGEVLGIQQSMFSLAQGIPPLIAGVSISISSSLPIIIGSAFVIFGWLALPRNQKA